MFNRRSALPEQASSWLKSLRCFITHHDWQFAEMMSLHCPRCGRTVKPEKTDKPMQEQLFTLIPLDPQFGTVTSGLTLLEAFTRLMAVAGRDYMFFRTGWVMHIVCPEKPTGEPEFESSLAVDAQSRAAIMRQVCEHGLFFSYGP
jgi:hypothetical protein